MAALLWFLSLMSGGVAAHICSVMPVVSNFRYFFKAIFPAVPLAVLLLAYLAGAADRREGTPADESAAGSLGSGADRCGKKRDRRGSRGGKRYRSAAVFFATVFVCVGVVNACDTIAFGSQLFGMRVEGSFVEDLPPLLVYSRWQATRLLCRRADWNCLMRSIRILIFMQNMPMQTRWKISMGICAGSRKKCRNN